MGDRWGAAFVRIGWQASFGLGGSFAPDWVAGITGIRNSAVALAPPCSESDPACYWGTGLETGTTLYLCLAGYPDPKALHFRRDMIMGCGSGLYSTQHNAVLFIRRTLKKMGILSA